MDNRKLLQFSALSFLLALFIVASCSKDEDPTMPADDPKNNLSAMPYQLLSEYQFFEGNMAEQTPVAGVIPYDLNSPLFSDYAGKLRYVWMPDGTSAEYKEEDVLDFPVGTIIIKTFYYDHDFRNPGLGRRIIETRLLIRKETEWLAATYLWNEAQTEATWYRVGTQLNVSWIDVDGNAQSTIYAVPNEIECGQCHNLDNVVTPIGPKVRNINKMYPYTDGAMNQLEKWVEAGYLQNAPSPAQAPKTPVWNDPATGTLDERARAYLDVNCGHCHNPQGSANNSGLNLYSNETEPTTLGICKAPIAAGPGSGGLQYSILPGKPDSSIMVFRMESIVPDVAMPELARSIIHQEGVDLIRDWITSLPPADCN